MATTWIKAIHKGGGSIANVLDLRIEYAKDFTKTEGGELINSFECAPATVQSEFLLSKRLYEQKTGRDQGKHDVIAYHIRMSFKPGEVTAEQALKLGRELAARWTKNKHQFIVAAHTNTNNPHCHIVYNSVNLDCDGKYQDFKRSAIALRRLSDQLCLEHGLSIIEEPKPSKGWNRNEYLGGEKAPSNRQRLEEMIDATLSIGMTFDEFIAAMERVGCEVKQGKHIAFKIPGAKKNIRMDSLSEDYSYEAILERLLGKRIIALPEKNPTPPKLENRPSLLIDIQAKIREGAGAGYEQWMRIFNIKQSARTLLFLKENGIDSYEDLVKKSVAASAEFNDRLTKIKAVEKRLKEISELQKHIGTYSKTREVYQAYRNAKNRNDFFEANRADVTLHRAAKKYFDELGLKKLPSINSLKQEYAQLTAQKKTLYTGYQELKQNRTALLTAKGNADRMLGITQNTQNRYITPSQKSNNSIEI